MTRSTTRLLAIVGIIAIGLGAYACGGGSPAGPTPSDAIPAKVQDGDGVAGASNNAPVLVYKTTPRHVSNEIFGKAPLQVKINTCNSSDPDPGDSIRTDVDWGDGVETGPHGPGAGTDPEDGNGPTGCGGPDCCRHRHEYKDVGRYTITIKLTDKHLEDQSGDVSASALTTATLTARVGENLTVFNFSSTDVPLTVTSFNTGSSSLTANGVTGTVSNVSPSMYITSVNSINSTVLSLLGPSGAQSTLFNASNTGTGFGNSCADRTTFDDNAGTPISTGTSPFAGSFAPDTPLSVFNGGNPNGQWRLQQSVTWTSTIQCWGVAITTN